MRSGLYVRFSTELTAPSNLKTKQCASFFHDHLCPCHPWSVCATCCVISATGCLGRRRQKLSTAIAFLCAVLVHIKQARKEPILACCSCKSWRTPISTLASDPSSFLGVVHPYNFYFPSPRNFTMRVHDVLVGSLLSALASSLHLFFLRHHYVSLCLHLVRGLWCWHLPLV